MSEWKDYKLGDIVNFQNGFAFKSSEFRYDGKYKIIRIKELKNGSVKFFEDTVSVSDEPNKAMSKFLVNKGDVIFALTGDPVSKSNPNSWVGRVSLYKHNEPAYLNQRTCKITQRGNVIPQYVFYYFRHYDNFYSLASKATGSASQANISTKTLEDTIIILPSLEVQTKIVNILSSLDEKIEINRKINARLEELAQALFKSWFIDFEPFGGQMPKDWEPCTLSDLTSECKDRVKNRSDVRVLSPLSSGELVLSDEYFTKQVYSKDISKYIVVKHKTFAYNPARINIGSIGINDYDFDGCVSPVYVVFKALDGYEEFINQFIKTKLFKEEVMLRAIGGVRQTLSYNDFSLIEFIKPTIETVTQYTNTVAPLYVQMNTLNRESTSLAELRDTLLPKLMSDKLIPE